MVRTIVIVAFDPCDTLDVAGPLEVFTVANQVMDARKSRRARYDVKVASLGERAVHTESGLVLTAHTTLKAELSIQSGERKPMRDLVHDIVEHPSNAHTLPDLAKRVAMSSRHFSHVFRAETGTSPAVFVERVRVEAARRLLEASTRSVEDVARVAGFGTTESLRRAFGRCLDLTPTEYRARFARAPASQG